MQDIKFSCPHCSAQIEADHANGGMAADCPACGELVVIPMPAPQPQASMGDTAAKLLADGAIGAAKFGWRATKIAAPIVAKAGLHVADRAATAVASSKAGKSAAKFIEDCRPTRPQNGLEKTGSAIRLVWVIGRNFFGW
jgi:hypothetical protein